MKTWTFIGLFILSWSQVGMAQYDRAFFQRQISVYPRMNAVEKFPTWAQNGDLLFYTSRPLVVNGKIIVEPQVDAHGNFGKDDGLALFSPTFDQGGLRLLVKMEWTGSAPAWSAVGRRITFSDGPKIGLLSLDESAVVAVNRNRVFRFDAAWSLDGKRLVMSGTHSPADETDKHYKYDRDIFVSEVKPKLTTAPLSKNRCIARLPGVDKLPLFTPDGQWVYFAHQDPIPLWEKYTGSFEYYIYRSQKNWSLYRVHADKAWNEDNAPEKIVSGLSEPDRLNFFPDGQRLLISFDNRYRSEAEQGVMAIVDIAQKSVTPYKLPTLIDQEKPTLQPLIPNEVALSPDGKQLAFSGLLWSGKAFDVGWRCIYTCDFDGTHLKRITPADQSPILAFDYKRPDLTPSNAWDKAFGP